MNTVGIVLIGRNEGERIRHCIASVVPTGHPIVYVDSGSRDGSVALARSLGAAVVELDCSKPFSAARGRNAGARQLLELASGIEFVFFMDGDCVAAPGWIDTAVAFLRDNTAYAVVAGRLRERYPEHSIYNRLCDMEWNTPVGDASACGGIAVYRFSAFAQAGQFDERMVAGEEPELCLRLRRAGWKVRRLATEMALHDAAMSRLVQWWKRAARSGHAYTEGAAMHWRKSEGYNLQPLRSILFWGAAFPILIGALAWPTLGLSGLLGLGYFILWFRIFQDRRARGDNAADARIYASFCIIGKCAQCRGVLTFCWNRWIRRRSSRLIEYKAPSTA